MTPQTYSDRWVMRFQARPDARLRLFCLPYAGGAASIYRTWSLHLPPEIEVCAIQLPGRESRLPERPFERLADLIPPLAQALRPYCTLPFVLFGHSMGALIGFELARAFRQMGDSSPLHLFASGCKAPQTPRRYAPIHGLPDEQFIESVRELNGTPEDVFQHAELRELLLPALRADFAVVETYTYTPAPALSCPITAFGGLQDTRVAYDDITLWREQTRAAFTLRMFPGGHFFLRNVQASLVQALCSQLQPLYLELGIPG